MITTHDSGRCASYECAMQRSRPRLAAAIPTVLATLIALAGCGNSSEDGSAEAPGGTSAPSGDVSIPAESPCAAVGAAAIEAATGLTEVEVDPDSGAGCFFVSAEASGVAQWTSQAVEGLRAGMQQSGMEPQDEDVGDDAFSYLDDDIDTETTVGLYAQQGSASLMVLLTSEQLSTDDLTEAVSSIAQLLLEGR